MTIKSFKNINVNLQFLHRQNEFLNPKLRRLLCNSFIQPHSDYAYISGHSLVSKETKKKIKFTQDKFNRFCLKLKSRHHIEAKEFKKLNWLLTKEQVEKHVATNVFKYWKGTSPFYVCFLRKYR